MIRRPPTSTLTDTPFPYTTHIRSFSPTAYSGLPDLAMPGEPDAYPRRDAVAAYLEDYAAHFALPIRFGARVAAVSPIGNGGLAVRLGGGETMMAASVVAATGTFGAPHIPVIEGASSFEIGRAHV